MNKPFSQSCEENRQPIFKVLKEVLADYKHVLEIGSGTGQHAVYFCRHLPHLTWQASDIADNLPGIRLWLDEAGLDNLNDPIELDVNQSHWPSVSVDAIFSANTAHIMSLDEVSIMFAGIGQILKQGGVFCLYGPFNYHGQPTSDSNAQFDIWLKTRDPHSGLRDFMELDVMAKRAGLGLLHDFEMPVNNRILVWQRKS